MSHLLDRYRALIDAGGITPDPAQEKAALALDRLYADVTSARKSFFGFGGTGPFKGVYIYGGVGRGKSMLMDLFFGLLPAGIHKRRIHFHAFMIETHDWLHKRRADKAVDNLLPEYAAYVAGRVKVLCFDEFHVTDVADAMILSRLFTHLLDSGVVVVATSNWPPDRLYEGGLQRDRFLPFIELIKSRLQIVYLDSPTDYREEVLRDLETFLSPLNAETKAKIDQYFKKLSGGLPEQTEDLIVKGHKIPVRFAGGVARFTFAQLCEQPRGAEDYLTLARMYDTIILEGIPRLGYDRNNETKRLMTFVDVLYDERRRVFFTAEAPPEKLYHGSQYAFEFERTVSRLQEMQSSSYQAVGRAEALGY